MSSDTTQIGTLVVVIMKARHLPNKRTIGKQDPYCSVTLNGEIRRSAAVKRGGQHPEWDEEVRFELFEESEDEPLSSLPDGASLPPPPPPKKGRALKKIKGGNIMQLRCYADDPREPDLIGEAIVDLSEVLTKGETDDWFTLMHKNRYSGEVYLELSFYSNAKPPEKKLHKVATIKHYGGPGSFTSPDENTSTFESSRITPNLKIGAASRHATGQSSMSQRKLDGGYTNSQFATSIAESVGSMSTLGSQRADLYSPSYENTDPGLSVESLTGDFGELHFGDQSRQSTFPPPQARVRASSMVGYSSLPTQHSQTSSGYHQAGLTYDYDQPVLANQNLTDGGYISAGYTLPPNARGGEIHPPQYVGSSVRRAGPRYSLPSTSSGFTPIPTPVPSLFTTSHSHGSEPALHGLPHTQSTYTDLRIQPGFVPLQSNGPSYPPPSRIYDQPESHYLGPQHFPTALHYHYDHHEPSPQSYLPVLPSSSIPQEYVHLNSHSALPLEQHPNMASSHPADLLPTTHSVPPPQHYDLYPATPDFGTYVPPPPSLHVQGYVSQHENGSTNLQSYATTQSYGEYGIPTNENYAIQHEQPAQQQFASNHYEAHQAQSYSAPPLSSQHYEPQSASPIRSNGYNYSPTAQNSSSSVSATSRPLPPQPQPTVSRNASFGSVTSYAKPPLSADGSGLDYNPPPPPPPPLNQFHQRTTSLGHGSVGSRINIPPPPPLQSSSPTGRPSLPQTPTKGYQQGNLLHIPNPPPPTNIPQPYYLPPSQTSMQTPAKYAQAPQWANPN